MSRYITIVLLTLFSGWKLTAGQITPTCDYRTDCSCATKDGKVLNLKGLGSGSCVSPHYAHTVKRPHKPQKHITVQAGTKLPGGFDVIHACNERQTTKDPSTNIDYIWEPCKSFSIGDVKDASVVKHTHNPDMYTDIGSLTGVQFIWSDPAFNIYLVSQDITEASMIACNCKHGGTKWTFLPQSTTPGFTTFSLDSPFCCPGYRPSNKNNSLSVGSILTITFFVILVIYLLFGFVFQTAVRKQNGVQRIPHVTFWTAVPGLIGDGCKFIISKTCRRSATYNEI